MCRVVRPPGRDRLRRRRPPPRAPERPRPDHSGRHQHGDVRLPPAREADLHLGHAMTTPQSPPPGDHHDGLQDAARRHLWMHFTRMSSYDDHDIPVIVRGDGAYVWDSRGKRYLDGLSGLFVTQVGHGRQELADAAGKQAATLAYFPLWSYAHPTAVELAERLAGYAPGDINRVFFTTGGSEAVESAWKLARQYFKEIGEPTRHKVISRDIASHGATMGALSVTGLASIKAAFEPLVPGSVRVVNTDYYRAPSFLNVSGDDGYSRF